MRSVSCLVLPHIAQSEPSNRVQLRRCAVRLLMTSASFSPADFSSPIGFLGRSESVPYYPTGDLQKDRMVAFTAAMDCLDHLEVHLPGNDDIRIATTLFELAQALSDLGLHKYALDTSSFALDTLEHPYVATLGDARHRVASILSLRGSILCDLKQNDEAVDAAHRAVTLFREHRDSQNTPNPAPELAFASLNYAVLLNSIGLKDECAAVVFELLGEVDESQPDMKDISALCNLCLSNMRFDAEDGMDLSTTEETIKLTQASSDAISQTALAGALLNKSKILSSGGQNETAISFSAEAVTLLRGMSAARPIFSLFLAHALDNHSHILLQANYKCESYSIRHDAIELWQTLKISAPDPIARPLAWSLFEVSKFRHEGGERNVLREELRVAECAVDAFRGVVPLDIPGLADALYLFAVRMLELDKNREAATYAEESAQHFREACAEDPKYALDLIYSLSLASSCLAYTERGEDAFEFAKQAVEVQRGRKGLEDKQYDAHLRRLLMDVVTRSMEMDKVHEALPWLQDLQALDPSIGTRKFSHFDRWVGGINGGPIEKSWNPLLRRSDMSQDNGEGFRKQTTYWMDPNADALRPRNSFAPSTPVASSSTIRVDKGKGKELAPSPEVRSYTAQDTKGKAKEGNPMFELNTHGHSPADEEIFSPGAAAQRRLANLRNMSPLQGDIFGGAGGNDHLNGLSGMFNSRDIGGRTLGGLGTSGLGMGGMGIGRDSGAQGGASSSPSSTTRTGTWSGMGIQSKLSDQGS
jgi:tetratricopeptide (TPR) repeat protein